MLTWLKSLALGSAIRNFDDFEPILAGKIREAQKKLGEIPPEEFAKNLVDEIQLFLCKKLGVDPKKVGIETKP